MIGSVAETIRPNFIPETKFSESRLKSLKTFLNQKIRIYCQFHTQLWLMCFVRCRIICLCHMDPQSDLWICITFIILNWSFQTFLSYPTMMDSEDRSEIYGRNWTPLILLKGKLFAAGWVLFQLEFLILFARKCCCTSCDISYIWRSSQDEEMQKYLTFLFTKIRIWIL